jgi:hypothetical protein
MFLRILIILCLTFHNSMYTPIIIGLFLIGLLITSTILPFTSIDIFLNTAMAQKNGYDDYVNYDSDINYNTNKIYSDYPDEENKYECQKGPFEGFFVSSVEFCKRAPLIIDGEGNVMDNQGRTGTIDSAESTETSATKLYTVIGNTTSIQ